MGAEDDLSGRLDWERGREKIDGSSMGLSVIAEKRLFFQLLIPRVSASSWIKMFWWEEMVIWLIIPSCLYSLSESSSRGSLSIKTNTSLFWSTKSSNKSSTSGIGTVFSVWQMTATSKGSIWAKDFASRIFDASVIVQWGDRVCLINAAISLSGLTTSICGIKGGRVERFGAFSWRTDIRIQRSYH